MITLLPEQAKKSIRNLYRRRIIVTELFFFAWLIIVCIIFLIPTLIVSNEKKQHAQERVQALESTTISTTTPLRITVASINKKVGLFSTTPQKSITTGIIDPMLSSDVAGITITDIQIKQKEKNIFTVSLAGVAKNREVLGVYAKKLEDIEAFSAVVVPLDNYLKGETLPMTITFLATI